MADRPGSDGPPERAGRRRFKDRSDPAVDLLREALASLGSDRAAVERALGALTRLYNPLVDAPVVDLDTRRRVMVLVDEGRISEAGEALRERYRRYAPPDGESTGTAGPD